MKWEIVKNDDDNEEKIDWKVINLVKNYEKIEGELEQITETEETETEETEIENDLKKIEKEEEIKKVVDKDYVNIVSTFIDLLPKENKVFCIKVLQINNFDIRKAIAWLVVDNWKIQRLRRKLRKKFNVLDNNQMFMNRFKDSFLCCL